MIPQRFIDELLHRVDIVDVVGQYVQLKKAGINFSGLCPFHREKSPSFTVAPTKQFFHCFGCGKNGTAITFLVEHLGVSFPEAIEMLAGRAGMTVPHEGGKREDPVQRQAEREHVRGLSDVLAQAAQFYRQRLKTAPRAIDYLKQRGLTGEIAARYRLGYAPDAWQGLQAVFPHYDDPMLVEAGLVITPDDPAGQLSGTGASAPIPAQTQDTPARDAHPGDRQGRRYDRFRDRIMFPITNLRGETIGFGGRVMGKGEPKYLNSPETPVFHKGRELYGAWEGREAIRAAGSVVVVEGYMDVIALAQQGIGNAVATLGTATTPDHLRILFRLADHVIFAFDGDAAGRKAARRALEASLPAATDMRRVDFLFLPAEDDPDTLVRREGVEGWQRQLAQALPLSEFLMQEVAAAGDLQVAEGRARALALAKPWIASMPQGELKHQIERSVQAMTSPPRPWRQGGGGPGGWQGRGGAPGQTGGWGGPGGPGGPSGQGGWQRAGQGPWQGGGPGGWQGGPGGQGGGQRGSWRGGDRQGKWGNRGGQGGYGGGGSGGWGQDWSAPTRVAPKSLAETIGRCLVFDPSLLSQLDPRVRPELEAPWGDFVRWLDQQPVQGPRRQIAALALSADAPPVVSKAWRDVGDAPIADVYPVGAAAQGHGAPEPGSDGEHQQRAAGQVVAAAELSAAQYKLVERSLKRRLGETSNPDQYRALHEELAQWHAQQQSPEA